MENHNETTSPKQISSQDFEVEKLNMEIILLTAEKAVLLESYKKALRNLESLNAIINTVAAHGTLLEDQLDIELKAARFQAIHDPLTQIYNRLGFNELLATEFEKPSTKGESVSFIMLDIDHFKHVNDKYGHDAGDRVLKALCGCIKMHLPDACVFSRWGGEEFMIMAPKFTLVQAHGLSEYLRTSIEKLPVEGIESITCSFGATEYNHDESIGSLFTRVDECLYEAKKNGRNQVCIR